MFRVCRLHGQYSIARFNTGSPLHKTGLGKAFCDGPEALARSGTVRPLQLENPTTKSNY